MAATFEGLATFFYCKCGRHGSNRPPPPEDEIFLTSHGGYRETWYEETHSRKECLRFEAKVVTMDPIQ